MSNNKQKKTETVQFNTRMNQHEGFDILQSVGSECQLKENKKRLRLRKLTSVSAVERLRQLRNRAGSSGKTGFASRPVTQLKMILPSRPLPFWRG